MKKIIAEQQKYIWKKIQNVVLKYTLFCKSELAIYQKADITRNVDRKEGSPAIYHSCKEGTEGALGWPESTAHPLDVES